MSESLSHSKVIDYTPTWVELADAIAAGAVRGDANCQHELHRMAQLADGVVSAASLDSDLLMLLRQVNEALSGVQEYEGLWLNAPTVPEVTPAKLVRHALNLPTT